MTRQQFECDVAAAAVAEDDRGGEPELLDQRCRVIRLRGDLHHLPSAAARAS
jgi:hypothetical protein